MTDPTITSGGKERQKIASRLLSKAFEQDPVIRYMLSSMTPKQRKAYLPQYFSTLLTAAAMNNAVFDEAEDWASCAVWMPPEHRVDNTLTLLPAGFIGMLWNVGIRGCWRMLLEFGPLSDAAKAKGLKKGEKYYYLFFIGTKQESRGKGLSSALIRRFQDIATKKQRPLWLESTTAYSRDIYASLGFKVVSEMVLGKGEAAPDGTQLKGGDGVKVWAMLWRPAA